MNYNKFRFLNNKDFFTINDIKGIFGIKENSAKVLALRYLKKRLFIRIKRGIYITEMKWRNLLIEERFKIANFLQVPSYISLNTALSYYGLTTQIQQDFIENIGYRRKYEKEIEGVVFTYYIISKEYYFGFIRKENFFIATPEKALVDAVYLYSIGRYSLDIDSLDFKGFDRKKLKKTAEKFPERTKKILKELCNI